MSSKLPGLGSFGVGVAVEVWCRVTLEVRRCPSLPLPLGWGSVGLSRAMGGFASHRYGFPLKRIRPLCCG